MALKIYTIIYSLFYVGITFSPEQLKLSGVWEWVDTVCMITAITGMLSYAFAFRVLTRRFWDYYFYLFIIFELVYMAWLQEPLLLKLGIADKALLANSVNVLMMAPVAVSLHRLQKRWSSDNSSDGQEKMTL